MSLPAQPDCSDRPEHALHGRKLYLCGLAGRLVKVNRNSWHYNVITTMGPIGNGLPTTLCQYFWQIVMIGLIWTALACVFEFIVVLALITMLASIGLPMLCGSCPGPTRRQPGYSGC